jgi:hypothetical protein
MLSTESKSYFGGDSSFKNALSDPSSNGGWCGLDVSGAGLTRGVLEERQRWEGSGLASGVEKVTLPAIMNELENLGHRPAKQPKGLTVTMRDYQVGVEVAVVVFCQFNSRVCSKRKRV